MIGLSIARRVAADGLRVCLLERALCGHESSWAGAGVLAHKTPHRRDTIAQLIERSLEQYPAFCAALHEETGIDTEYERCGELSLLFQENDINIARAAERARLAGPPRRVAAIRARRAARRAQGGAVAARRIAKKRARRAAWHRARR